MKNPVSYLKFLKFDQNLNKSWLANYLQNPRLVILIVLSIILLGVSGFLALPKVLNPEIKIPIVIINTSLPGAGPKDVESLITIPIEDSVNNLSRLDTVTSTSQDSVSSVVLQFTSGTDPDKALSDAQTAVTSLSTLPKDATKPNVQKLDFSNVPVWSFNISSSLDNASLMNLGQTLKTALKDLPTVDQVNTVGLETTEIQILINPEAVNRYQISPQMLSQAITTATNSFPAGSLKTSSSNFALTIDNQTTSVEELRKLRVNLNGNKVALSDIATVAEVAKPDQPPSYLATSNSAPTKSIRFDVYKTSNASIAKAVLDSKKLVNQTLQPYQNRFLVSSILDTGQQIDDQFNELVRDFTITVSLVFIVLLIFLGFRQALVASLAIPLTFLITFSVMNLTSIDLSFIAFFSLLLSLGLLVDDTVVVISAMTAYFRTGKFSPIQTGLLVWRDFVTAIFTTTITTVWAFLPLLLSTGIIGEFIKPIPIVVSTSLLASFGVAMLITLPFVVIVLAGYFPKRVLALVKLLILLLVAGLLIAILPKSPVFIVILILFSLLIFIFTQTRDLLAIKVRKKLGKLKFNYYLEHGLISFEVIGRKYRQILGTILSGKSNRRRALIMVAIFSVFSYLLFPLGLVQNEFFPKTEGDSLSLSLELPQGTNLDQSQVESLKILDDLRHTPDTDFVTASIGLGVDSSSGDFTSQSANTVLFTLNLVPKSNRHLSSFAIADQLRQKYQNYPLGKISVIEASGGPPAGSDVQIKLFGPDSDQLDVYANKIEDYLKSHPGVENIDKSIKPGTSKISFVPDQQKLLDNNLTIDQVGFWLRTFASGSDVQSVKFDSQSNLSQEITIRVNAHTPSVENLDLLNIPTSSGNVPLSSLGTLVVEPNPTLITREESKRTLSVTASVKTGFVAATINKNLEDFANSLNLQSGYSWQTGGVNEENQKSVTSILQAMALSFLLIIITMVLQFKSFRKALIVMMVIPLSVSGVFIIFALTHTPLSFPALIGILALFGIVVKNAILVVDKINQNNKAGLEFKDAIIDAAESRLEPIALTSFTAIIGLLPITLSNPLWRGLGGAIIAGLTFSGTIMLFFIPVIYYLIFVGSEGKKR